MVYKTREIENALIKKGFEENRQGCHKVYTYVSGGKRIGISTMTSHGNIEYSGRMLSNMRKQLFLERRQFDDLVKCPLTKEELIQIYRNQGY